MASSVEGMALCNTQANVARRHIPAPYVKEHFRAETFGCRNSALAGHPIDFTLNGPGPCRTDIVADRTILRFRSEGTVGRFHDLHNAKGGSRPFFGKTGDRAFRITVIH